MHDHPLRPAIERFWEERQSLGFDTKGEARDSVDAVLAALDEGSLRVAAPSDTGWVVHEWLKKAVLLSFRLNDSVPMDGGSAPVFVSEGKVYKIDADSKSKVMSHLGHKVTINGSVEGNTVKIDSVKMASELFR